MSSARSWNIEDAREEVTASSAGGSPFLAAYGMTFLATGILSFFLPRETSALIAIFQGGIALPAALWCERRVGWQRMSADNPLKKLSGQMAFSQSLAIPFLIVVYNIDPGQIPICLAGLAGVHLFPYGWLHRTPLYPVLAVAVAMGSFGLLLSLQSQGYPWELVWIGVAYLAAAPALYVQARRRVLGRRLENASAGIAG